MRRKLIVVLLFAVFTGGVRPTAAIAPAPAIRSTELTPTPLPVADLWLDVSLGRR